MRRKQYIKKEIVINDKPVATVAVYSGEKQDTAVIEHEAGNVTRRMEGAIAKNFGNDERLLKRFYRRQSRLFTQLPAYDPNMTLQ